MGKKDNITIGQTYKVIELISRKICILCKGLMDIPYKPTIPLCRECRIIYLERLNGGSPNKH